MTVDIVPLEIGCQLTLTHELHPDWADYASRTEAGWTKMIDALAQTLEQTPRAAPRGASSGDQLQCLREAASGAGRRRRLDTWGRAS